ncbi:unnamed protein product [Rhizophagus irregularis]|uniref:Serine-threonine/tyrosine-protein kinase catalytic domain-containing protein n=1 Tax=Rhizophagus irregularis TaxID=588596 RepID=A0A915YVM7_9GLOM|nr:unnamed protein product [Rhizophagus irregularis]
MNEFLSEEIPFNDIPHDEFLAIKICKGLRPTISKDVPKLLADLIIKCWDAEIKNRPTTKELYQILTTWNNETKDIKDSEYSEYSEYDEDSEDDVDSENDLSSFQFSSDANYTTQSTLVNPMILDLWSCK